MEQAWRLNLFPIQALHWSSEVRSQQRERSWRKHWAPPLSLIRTVRALIPAKLRFVANDSRWLNLARDKWPWDRMCSVSCQLLRSMPHFSRPSHLTGLALITLPSYPPSTAGWREGTRPLTSLLRNETRFNGLSITFSYFNHVPLANNFNCLSFTGWYQSQQLLRQIWTVDVSCWLNYVPPCNYKVQVPLVESCGCVWMEGSDYLPLNLEC